MEMETNNYGYRNQVTQNWEGARLNLAYSGLTYQIFAFSPY